MSDKLKLQDRAAAVAKAGSGVGGGFRFRGLFVFEAFDARGKPLWRQSCENRIVTSGLTHAIQVVLGSGTQITAWYMGLLSATPTIVAGDIISSHSGWTEVVAYSESVRQVWTPGSITTPSADNSAAKATFSINVDSTTMGGAFIVGGTGASTKSAGTGTLLSAVAFTLGNQTLNSGSSLQVTWTCTGADDGV